MALTKVSTGLISADLASVDLNIDANTLYIDVTNNRVGINNTGPATALDVTGTVTADGLSVDSGSTNTQITLARSTTHSGISFSTQISDFGGGGADLIFDGSGNSTGFGFRPTNSSGTLQTGLVISPDGNVGIGTASPASLLHIENSAGGSGGYAKFTDVTHGGDVRFGMADGVDNNAVSGAFSNNDYLFYTNSLERMRIDASGSVIVNNTGGDSQIYLGGSTGSSRMYLARSGTDSLLFNVDNGVVKFGTNNTEVARIDSAGDLSVANGNQTANAVSSRINFGNRGTFSDTSVGRAEIYGVSEGSLWYSGTGLAFSTNPGPDVTATSPIERMRIFSNGDLSLGTSERTFASTDRTCFEISGADNSLFALSDTFSGSLENRFYIHNDRTGGLITYLSQSGIDQRWYTGGGETMRLTNGGDLLVGGTAAGAAGCVTLRQDGVIIAPEVYNTAVTTSLRDLQIDSSGFFGYSTSTRATKDNIELITDVSWLLNLEPVSFNRKITETEVSAETEYGLIADDVELINPNICFYDETEDGQELVGITYSKLITPILKLVQEQQEQIEQLKAEVAALKGVN